MVSCLLFRVMRYSHSNRALCYINLLRYAPGEKDADKSISLDPLFVKSWLRRGICRMGLKRPQQAYFDLLRVSFSALV